MSHLSAEAIAGHRIVKAFGGEEREASKFKYASQHFYRTTMKVTSVLSMLPPLMEFIGGIAFVAALVYGSQEIMAGRLTPGEFTAFIVALFMMYAPAKKLSRVKIVFASTPMGITLLFFRRVSGFFLKCGFKINFFDFE